MSSLFSWLGWLARKSSDEPGEASDAASTSSARRDNQPQHDGRKLAEIANAALEVPADASLAQIFAAMDAGKKLASPPRDAGDAEMEATNTATDQAKASWRIAVAVTDRMLESARRYSEFPRLLTENGTPAPKINIPLLPDETLLVKRYCDTLGQQGGLFRRLNEMGEARRFYAMGAQIERHGDSFGFAGSYSTVNHIAVRIELGEAVAQHSSTGLPTLSEEIADSLAMVVKQIEGSGRSSDPWAWADYAFLLLLSGKAEEAARYIAPAYETYTSAAGARDIKTTLRVMNGVANALAAAGDQTNVLLRWGMGVLKEHATSKGKHVE